jgi:hypothetical protein
MKIEILNPFGDSIAEIRSEEVEIMNAQDALDILVNCTYQGARKIIIHEKNIIPDFFDLSSGIAGEVLQKFSTYDAQLSIIGDYEKFSSKSLHDFIYESNKAGRVTFVSSMAEARAKLNYTVTA